MRFLKVGGCVRDHLMGVEPKDIDWLVVGATPEQMLAKKYLRVGADFPVFLHPKTKDEYALARKERKTSAGHRGFQTVFDPSVTVEEDLSRRDLTMNAMAMDPRTKEIFDPHGGRADIGAKILRHVSEAFSEDPLRVLRLARFGARTGFSVAPETMALCKKICADGLLQELSIERVSAELLKIFQSPHPAAGMELLIEMGALASLDPAWPSRLSAPSLEALSAARQAGAPEWSLARLACCQWLEAKESKAFLERMRFSGEVARWGSRLGAFCSWASSGSPDQARACSMLESCGAPKYSDAQLGDFWTCAEAELSALGVGEQVLGQARAALFSAKAIAQADLSEALAMPAKQMPEAVRAAKLAAFSSRWPSALAAPKPLRS